MKRVLLWSPNGAGKHYGGPGTAAYRMYARAFEQFEVTLAHGFRGQESHLFHSEHLVTNFDPSPVGQLRFIHSGKRWIARNIRRYDVFHGLTTYRFTLDPAIVAARQGIPTAVKVASQGSEVRPTNSILANILRSHRARVAKLNRLDAIIAISSEIAHDLLEGGVEEKRIVRIPNGVDTCTFCPVETQMERTQTRNSLGLRDVPTILFVGAVVPRKRPHLLVAALPTILKEVGECQVVFVGPEKDVGYSRSLRTLITDRNLDNHVVFSGHQHDIAPYYRAADVFSLPSEREGMANSVLEAMASGLPVVVTDASGMHDLVRAGIDGFVAPPSSSALAASLLDCLTSVAMRPGQAHPGRVRILSSFSTAAVLEQHELLFARISATGIANL